MTSTTINHPETQALEVRIIELSDTYRQYRITCDDDLKRAKAALDAIAVMLKDEDLLTLSQSCSDADKLHKTLVGLRNKILVPLQSIDKYLRDEVASYLDAQDRRHKELLAKLQERADEQHRAKVAEEFTPWDDSPPPAAPPIALAKAPQAVKGLALRKKPAQVEVHDFSALLKAAAENPDLRVFVVPNLQALTETARRWGKKITEERIPGVRVNDTRKTVSRR